MEAGLADLQELLKARMYFAFKSMANLETDSEIKKPNYSDSEMSFNLT